MSSRAIDPAEAALSLFVTCQMWPRLRWQETSGEYLYEGYDLQRAKQILVMKTVSATHLQGLAPTSPILSLWTQLKGIIKTGKLFQFITCCRNLPCSCRC
eukprot:2609058-Amphidinium_carterae.1